MRRRRRRPSLGRRIVIGCVVVVIGVFAAAIAARVTVLELVIDSALEAHGFTDAHYKIASVGVSEARLADIQLGGELAVKEISLRYGPWPLTHMAIEEIAVSGLRVDLTGMDASSPSGPLARLLAGSDAPSAEPPSGLPSIPPLSIADGVLRLPGKITVTLDRAQWSSIDEGAAYTLAVADMRLARGEQQLALRDAAARIATDFLRRDSPVAQFTVAAVSHENEAPLLAPLAVAGSIAAAAEVWRVKATATGARGTQFTMTGSYDWSSKAADARVTLPAMRFAPDGLQPGEIVPPLAVLTAVRGAIDGYAGLRWKADRAAVEGALRIEDLDFTVASAPVSGLSARLALSSEGAGAHPDPVLRIDQARVTIADGVIEADPATVRPLAESNRLSLRVAGLDLARVLAALEIDGVSGEGRVDGRVPIVLSDGAVAVEAGKLQARGPGVLRIVSQQAAAALGAGGDDANLLLQALADFHYDRLALSVDKPLSGESRLALSIYGHNPAVLEGHPSQINVTITTNLDKILGVIAEGGRLSQEVIRAIVGAR
jgi:hypothetical protein